MLTADSQRVQLIRRGPSDCDTDAPLDLFFRLTITANIDLRNSLHHRLLMGLCLP